MLRRNTFTAQSIRASGTPLWIERPAWPAEPRCGADVTSSTPGRSRNEAAGTLSPDIALSTFASPREFFIQGVTLDGRTFRPSDWAERLAGAMSSFRPEGAAGGIGAFIGYSPLCVPRVINGVKCVIVSEALKAVEPMAWDFVMSFARDNQLQMTEACLMPERRWSEPGQAE